MLCEHPPSLVSVLSFEKVVIHPLDRCGAQVPFFFAALETTQNLGIISVVGRAARRRAGGGAHHRLCLTRFHSVDLQCPALRKRPQSLWPSIRAPPPPMKFTTTQPELCAATARVHSARHRQRQPLRHHHLPPLQPLGQRCLLQGGRVMHGVNTRMHRITRLYVSDDCKHTCLSAPRRCGALEQV